MEIRQLINKVKNYKRFINENNYNITQILYGIAKEARNYVNKVHNLGGSFVDHCDVVSEK